MNKRGLAEEVAKRIDKPFEEVLNIVQIYEDHSKLDDFTREVCEKCNMGESEAEDIHSIISKTIKSEVLRKIKHPFGNR